jgi:hypothetical protein
MFISRDWRVVWGSPRGCTELAGVLIVQTAGETSPNDLLGPSRGMQGRSRELPARTLRPGFVLQTDSLKDAAETVWGFRWYGPNRLRCSSVDYSLQAKLWYD